MDSRIITAANTFVSRYTIKPERRADFLAIWDPLWRNHIDQMEAITHFVFYGWGRNKNVLVAIESYKDENLLAELRKSAVFQEKVSQLLDCCSEPMTMELFSGIDADRSIFERYEQGPSKVHPKGKHVGPCFCELGKFEPPYRVVWHCTGSRIAAARAPWSRGQPRNALIQGNLVHGQCTAARQKSTAA